MKKKLTRLKSTLESLRTSTDAIESTGDVEAIQSSQVVREKSVARIASAERDMKNSQAEYFLFLPIKFLEAAKSIRLIPSLSSFTMSAANVSKRRK